LEGEPEELGDGFSIEEQFDEYVPAPAVFGPPEWRADAACLGAGWDVMSNPLMEQSAKALCETCPVRADCLAFALDTEPSDGVWAGATFAERCLICPICQAPKDAESLGCNFGHVLLRIARLMEIQAEGDPDVHVHLRQKPSYRTSPYCVLPRGASHSSAKAYKRGCRCAAARRERNAAERRQTGAVSVRGPYRKEAAAC
jgi:WhiB family redox-sensing transcriptional regulator